MSALTTEPAPIFITVILPDGSLKEFSCDTDWTVGEIEVKIHTTYKLTGGRLTRNNITVKDSLKLEPSMNGQLKFVDAIHERPRIGLAPDLPPSPASASAAASPAPLKPRGHLLNDEDAMARALRNVVVDPRLRMFDPEVSTNIHSSASFKSYVRRKYKHRCVLCGTTENLTVAHLIANNDKEDYSVFQPPRYKTYFNAESIRNRIVICGIKSEVGTCHNLFDMHNITIFYNAMTKRYNAVCVRANPADLRFKTGDTWELNFPPGLTPDEMPYKRILAWRVRKCALVNAAFLSPEQLDSFATVADLSEAEEVADFNELADDAYSSEADTVSNHSKSVSRCSRTFTGDNSVSDH
eukprot:gene5913-6511_t